MPEGHVVHRLANRLAADVGGQPLAASSPQGRFAESAARIDGAVLQGTDAHGKHLLLDFGAERTVHVHLGLYGKFSIGTGPGPAPVGALRLRLATADWHADLRGPTRCDLIDDDAVAALHARLGPDPLRGDDPERFVARIARSATPVGRLLMDQQVAAGVGNIYRAEALFRAGLHPATPGRDVPAARVGPLWDDLVALMGEGLRTGRIDTVRPEHEPSATGRAPREDDHGGEVYVYRRDGQPCHVCGTEIRTVLEAGRTLFWCPTCQRRPRPRRRSR